MDFYPNAITVDEELSKRTALTKDNMIKKYGEPEGNRRWEKYCSLQAESNTFAYKEKKHGWSKNKFDEYNANRATTLKKCIDRYGEEEGLNRWQSYCDKQAYSNTKEYFIEKYGKELGYKKYVEYNIRKGNSSSPEYYSQKMGISLDEAAEYIISRNPDGKIYGSNLEKEFTEMLTARVGQLDHTTFAKPYGKWSNELNSYVIFDIKHDDFVIEFNGDYWHCNPKLYESTAIIKGGRTAQDIWIRDEKKIQTARNSGLRVLVVWESEFVNNRHTTIERVIKWIQNGRE
jgi:hypothetical protein